jgi:RimJ/RimL family protein N-acetyltransferase
VTAGAIQIPTIRTERLTLRGWLPADLDPLAALLADAEHARFIGPTPARGDVWRRMAAFIGHWSLRGYGIWAACEGEDGPFVGWCGLWYPEEWPEPEIGWALLPAMTGKGYATEAAFAARRFAYGALGWRTAISFIDMQNHASQRVAERMGARFEGTQLLRGSEAGVYRHPSPQDIATQTLN